MSLGAGRVVELGHELAVGGTGSGEFVAAFFELQPQVDDLLFLVGDLLVQGVDIGWGRRVPTHARPGRREPPTGAFQVLDAGAEPDGAFVRGEQVRLQRGSGDGRTSGVADSRFGLEGVDLFQQVAVPVDERPVDVGGAGDPGCADLGAFSGGAVEGGDDALSAAGGVGRCGTARPSGPPRSGSDGIWSANAIMRRRDTLGSGEGYQAARR